MTNFHKFYVQIFISYLDEIFSLYITLTLCINFKFFHLQLTNIYKF